MEYVSRYGLEFNPFLKNSKDILVENEEAKEVRFRLSYLTDTKGFGVLTGYPGLGKTTALRSYAASLNPSRFKVIYSCLSSLTVNDFYRSLVSSLGLEPRYRKPENFKLIQDAVNRLAIEKRITPVFIIDEANHINSGILNDLKSLFNFDMDSRDRAVVILSGLPQLNNTLNLNAHEDLRTRIIMNYHMEGLSKEEGRTYIQEKLRGAGCKQQVFAEPAIEAILNTANGVPRVINRLCDLSLLLGNSLGTNVIDAEIAMKAVNDAQLG